jgi:hypothetical protein
MKISHIGLHVKIDTISIENLQLETNNNQKKRNSIQRSLFLQMYGLHINDPDSTLFTLYMKIFPNKKAMLHWF